MFKIAVNGRDNEKVSIEHWLCCVLTGAHGLFYYENAFPAPADHAENESHLIGYAPMLNVLIVGIASVDGVQVFSLHGLASMIFVRILGSIFRPSSRRVIVRYITTRSLNSHAL